jgi:hypothetical protein
MSVRVGDILELSLVPSISVGFYDLEFVFMLCTQVKIYSNIIPQTQIVQSGSLVCAT